MVIDGIVSRLTDGAMGFDRDGAIAQKGEVLEDLLGNLMADPYFALAPPKSTGRELFGRRAIERLLSAGGSMADMVCTATAWTAVSIAQAVRQFVSAAFEATEVIISGGGSKNPFLMDLLTEYLSPLAIRRIEGFGMRSEQKEAVAFAILACETAAGRQGNVPAATGASKPVVLGSITPGNVTGNMVALQA